MKYVVVMTLIALLVSAPGASRAQIGIIDDIAKAATKGSRIGARGGRVAGELIDSTGRPLRNAPASGATRKAFGISLETSAAQALDRHTAIPGRLPVYLGMDGSDVRFVRDSYSNGWDHSNLPETHTLGAYLDALEESGQHVAGVDYVVETDVVMHPALRSASFNSEDQLFLANYSGRSWPLRKLRGREDYVAEVQPSLLVQVADDVLEDLTSLLDLSFDGRDMRIVSLFDSQADFDTVDKVRAAAGATPYKNLRTRKEALSVIAARRGHIVVVVGHVQDQSFVVVNEYSEELFRIGIHELNTAAQQHDVSLILLGCETACLPDVAGMVDYVNSEGITAQLRRALKSHSYGDFFAALGTQEAPFVVTGDVIDQARVLVASRITRDTRAHTAGVTTGYVTLKLAQAQTANTRQIFRSLPRWLDNVITFLMGVVLLVLGGSTVTSICKLSLSPLKNTIMLILGLLILPVAALVYGAQQVYRLLKVLT